VSWNRKRPECTAFEPSLVAYVYGEPHPGIPGLVAHLVLCPECRHEEFELRAVDAAVEGALASPPASSLLDAPRRRLRPGWLATHAAPAAAAVLIACVLLLGKGRDGTKDGRALRDASIFGQPAAAHSRSFDGTELDGRLHWITFQLKGLRGDPW
jgi:anti-sigma factor RsiW